MKKKDKINILLGFIITFSVFNLLVLFPYNLFYFIPSFQQENYFWGPILLVVSYGELILLCLNSVHNLITRKKPLLWSETREIKNYQIIVSFLFLPLLLINGTWLLAATVFHNNIIFFFFLLVFFYAFPPVGFYLYNKINLEDKEEYIKNGKVLKNKQVFDLYRKETGLSPMARGRETRNFKSWKIEKLEKVEYLPKILSEINNINQKSYELLRVPSSLYSLEIPLYSSWMSSKKIALVCSSYSKGTETNPIIIEPTDNLPMKFMIKDIDKYILIRNLHSKVKFIKINNCHLTDLCLAI